MKVIYDIKCKTKNNLVLNEKEFEEVVTKKLLKVMLNIEKNCNMILSNEKSNV